MTFWQKNKGTAKKLCIDKNFIQLFLIVLQVRKCTVGKIKRIDRFRKINPHYCGGYEGKKSLGHPHN